MDDDDFGGFEAAESFRDGNGQPQVVSPAIPWAAFPPASEIHLPQTHSTEVLWDQSTASACFVSSDPCFPSEDKILIDDQSSSSFLNLDDGKNQAPLSVGPSSDISVSTSRLDEDVDQAFANDEKSKLNGSDKHLQQTLANLEVKLKASDEEKCRIKKDLEDLLEKYKILETDFLKYKEDKLISHQDRYSKLQASLQSAIQQREEAVEKHYVSVIERQVHKCEELLIAQHQRLLDMLDKEHKALEEKTAETFLCQSQEHQEMLEKYMENKREDNREALAAAAKIEKENIQVAIIAAVKAEKENMEKLHREEKAEWQAERNKDHEKIAQAIEDAVEEQRQINQAVIKTTILEEQKKSEKAVEKAVKQTKEELMEYIKEQKRVDQVIRQRSLSSLELFLSCAQKQLSFLLQGESTITDAEEKEIVQ
uniref:Coiled-coil domain containing 91 n=1 Tax=Salvator merianae TaxID=96440 RepID=A0A8D0BMA6_SALMN